MKVEEFKVKVRGLLNDLETWDASEEIILGTQKGNTFTSMDLEEIKLVKEEMMEPYVEGKQLLVKFIVKHIKCMG